LCLTNRHNDDDYDGGHVILTNTIMDKKEKKDIGVDDGIDYINDTFNTWLDTNRSRAITEPTKIEFAFQFMFNFKQRTSKMWVL